MIKVFYSYSHIDEILRDKLEVHLSTLKNSGYISNWHDRKILPGEEWDKKISAEFESSDIILLLISPDFLAVTVRASTSCPKLWRYRSLR